VPIALEGTNRVHPMHAKRLFRARVTATIGKPMTAAQMLEAYPNPSKDALTIIGEATTKAIAALMTEPVRVLEVSSDAEDTSEEQETQIGHKNKWVQPLTLGAVAVILLLVARSKRRR